MSIATRSPLLLMLVLLASCGTTVSSNDSNEYVETVTADAQTEPDVVIGSPCKSTGDCQPSTHCIPSVQCLEGACQYTFANIGAPCQEGCFVNGYCDGEGSCIDLQPKDCPEVDGNICTVPSCDVASGSCFERVVDDGSPPYVSSDCFVGAICIGGLQSNQEAEPSALALECEAQSAALDPFGCIDKLICVGGEEWCKPVYKVDGSQCWNDADGQGCQGRSCASGECVVDHAYDAQCLEQDYPDECGDACQTCTLLECHWIPDPANPRHPSKMVRYCKPEARVGFACTEDPCLLGEVCSLGSQANGPLGKETLGACTGGAQKSKEQCLEELGKPPLECLKAGVSCDATQGGCHLKQEVADKWCWPPEWQCFDKNDTYCTHLDGGDSWNPDNGCFTAWVDLNCDDDNECTVDLCKVSGENWKCEHQPIDGAGCDDGDPCTVGGICVAGLCAQHLPKCKDSDENPCNDPSCDPFTGECKPAQTNGYPCNDANACTIGDTCQDLSCLSGAAKNCDDGNPCTDDFCDPSSGCLHDPNVAPCDDGDASTMGDLCAAGMCQPGTPVDCNDDNPCTADLPDPDAGCKYSNLPGPCSDDNVCTVGDACAAGQCLPGTALDCDDGKFCTIDSCHAIQGCQHTNLPDFNSCPGGANYGCINGECICQPECGGKTCGPNGCGGNCGTCPQGQDCLNGNCFCVPDCSGIKCGDDGCGGSCGTCVGGAQCVAGQCQGGGFSPSGTYSLSPAPSYSCAWGTVNLSLFSLQFVDNGSSLFISPAVSGCCSMQGDSAADGTFTASCLCPGGGACDEHYTLTGTFSNDTTWSGTFTAQYSGGLCLDCTTYSTPVTGTK
jgi:hypothetical protein